MIAKDNIHGFGTKEWTYTNSAAAPGVPGPRGSLSNCFIQEGFLSNHLSASLLFTRTLDRCGVLGMSHINTFLENNPANGKCREIAKLKKQSYVRSEDVFAPKCLIITIKLQSCITFGRCPVLPEQQEPSNKAAETLDPHACCVSNRGEETA